jgi:hypothetical protein
VLPQVRSFFMRSPEELGAAEVRTFLLHQIEVEQLATIEATLKFLLKGLRVLHQGADICPNCSIKPV